MDLVSQIANQDRKIARFVDGRARDLEAECREMAIDPGDAKLLVMWGGGKDSTLALILTQAVASIVGCGVQATTMAHPGLSVGTISNIEQLVGRLEVKHQWRQFVRVVDDAVCSSEKWSRLYGALFAATKCCPRFMCVACNLGSTVVEFQGLKDHQAHFRVTGNAPAELRKFDEWAAALVLQFGSTVHFPPPLDKPMLNYYRVWWAIYDALLSELCSIQAASAEESLDKSDYLYELPAADDAVGDVRLFSVLGDDEVPYKSSDFQALLKSFGWRLPDDIQGGTESDCMMPAAIAALDIQQNGLDVYKAHLAQAVATLSPLPEMYERAKAWADSGRSISEGERLLNIMGLPRGEATVVVRAAPIAMALCGQLLPVR